MKTTRRGILLSGLGAVLPLSLPPSIRAATTLPNDGVRRRNFNEAWRFFRGEAGDAGQAGFDDSRWRQLRLPHDWAIEGPFDPKANPHTGALPIFGTGWYRKAFTLPGSARGRYFSVEFDGAMANAKVWLNGSELGGRPYGYSSFELDLTPHLKFGEANVLAVRLTPEDRSSRWYPGAGIYRNVWLTATGPVHVAHWGTYITTPQLTESHAEVSAKIEVRNRDSREAKIILRNRVLDAGGKTWPRVPSKRRFPPMGVKRLRPASRWRILSAGTSTVRISTCWSPRCWRASA